MKKGGVFCFAISSLILKIFIQVFVLCKLEIDEVISSYSLETNHKKKNFSGKNG